MAVDPIPGGDRKSHTNIDMIRDEDKNFLKARRLFRSASILYPILLALILIVGTVLLVITVTRRNTCRQLQAERIEVSPKELVCKINIAL